MYQLKLFNQKDNSMNDKLSSGKFPIKLELRALSWKQPFAELMLHGKIETRSWKTKYRGWVLLCATKKGFYTEELKRISGSDIMMNMFIYTGINPKLEGKAFAIGKLIDCRPMKKEDESKCFVKYNPDLFCHIYDDIKPIKQINWKGCQGWKKVNEDIKEQIIII